MLKSLQHLDTRLWEWCDLQAAATFIVRHKALLGFLALVAILAHPYTLFSFSLSMDSESHAFNPGAKELWVQQGRWGMYLLNYCLLPDSVIPFFPPLLALAGCAIGAFFLVLTLSPVRSYADYLAAPIAIGCPIIYFALYFTTLGYGVGIAFATTSVSLYALTRWTRAGTVAATLLLAFSIGIYQAMLPLAPVIFAMYVIARTTSEKPYPFLTLLLQTAIFMAVLGLAFYAYQQVSQALMAAMDLDFDAGYLGGYIQFQPTPEYIRTALIETFTLGKDYYTGGSQFYINELPVLKWLFTGTATIVAMRLLTATSQSIIVRLLGICAFLLAVLAPLSMLFATNGLAPPRTLPSVAYVLAGMVFISARSSSHTIRILVTALVIACFYKFCIINTRYALATQMRWQADRELSTRIVERLGLLWDTLPPRNPGDPYRVVLVGELDTRKESPLLLVRSVVGDSFYAWGGGDTRMIGLWYTMGIFDYFVATPEQNLSVTEAAEKMPAWPAQGSVAAVNGVFVVKLSDYTSNQKIFICLQNPTHPFCVKHGAP